MIYAIDGVIQRLQEIRRIYGNLPVTVWDSHDNIDSDISAIVVGTTSLGSPTREEPCVIIGDVFLKRLYEK